MYLSLNMKIEARNAITLIFKTLYKFYSGVEKCLLLFWFPVFSLSFSLFFNISHIYEL